MKPSGNSFSDIMQFCPGCGKAAGQLKTDRVFNCQECGFQLFFNVAGAICALISNDDGNLLFCERALNPRKGALDFPGGFVEPYETAEQALDREIKEELGVNVLEKLYFGSFYNQYLYNGVQYNVLDVVYSVTVDTSNQMTASDDVAGLIWSDPGALLSGDRLAFPSVRKIVEMYCKVTG